MLDDTIRRRFAGAMAEVIAGVCSGTLGGAAAAARLREGAQWLVDADTNNGSAFALSGEPEPEPAAKGPMGPSKEEIEAVFQHWQTVTRRFRAHLTAGRRSTIRARLRDGFSVPQLCAVSSWAASDPWMTGENDRSERYDTVETLFRSQEKVEKYLEKAGWRDGAPRTQSAVVEDLKRQAAQALLENRVDDYQAINARIKEQLHV